MSRGKAGNTIRLLGAALLAWCAGIGAGETHLPGNPSVYYRPDGELVSLRKNAAVTIGGELRVDYAYRRMSTGGIDSGISLKCADLAIKNANLRISADLHPNVKAVFKLDLNGNAEDRRDRDEILEEALVVMRSVGGLEFFAGKGRAPYGQDVTMGMIQSYHHAGNRADSSEGRVFIIDPPDENTRGGPGRPLAPMRPGQFDRTFLAGAAYEWSRRWRVEAAVFQPNSWEYRGRLVRSEDRRGEADIGAAARLWIRPVEALTVEISGIMARSDAMGRTGGRLDVPSEAKGRKQAFAFSAGFDWRDGPWRVFGEYQHGWDWNFTDDYHTDAWQIGLARNAGSSWRIGGMVEGLRINGGHERNIVDNYYKLSINIRYVFSSGLFVLAEYGHEWFRRARTGSPDEKRTGHFFGFRTGISF